MTLTMLDTPATTIAATTTVDHVGLDLQVLQGSLKRTLAMVSRAAASEDSPLPPVFRQVLLDATAGLRLAATNGMLAVIARLPATIRVPGAVTLPAKAMTELVGRLPSDTLQLTLDEATQAVTVQSGRIRTQLAGLEAEEFPALPNLDAVLESPWFSLTPETLRVIIEHVADAAAPAEGSRPALTGVAIRTRRTQATFVATDGYRMCLHEQALEVDTGGPQEALVPAVALIELGRMLKEADPNDLVEVFLPARGNQVLFRCGPLVVAIQLLAFAFMDIERALALCHRDTTTLVATTDLLAAIRRAVVVAAKDANVIKLHLTPSEATRPGQLTLTAQSETGTHTEVLDVACEGEGGTVAVNAKFFQKTVDAFKGTTLVLETGSAASPVVVRREPGAGPGGPLAMLMPLSVR